MAKRLTEQRLAEIRGRNDKDCEVTWAGGAYRAVCDRRDLLAELDALRAELQDARALGGLPSRRYESESDEIAHGFLCASERARVDRCWAQAASFARQATEVLGAMPLTSTAEPKPEGGRSDGE